MTETATEPEEEHRACPACGAVMSLESTLPGLGGLPELKTFKCEVCGEVDVVETSR